MTRNKIFRQLAAGIFRGPKRGFALVIALMLMILLTMLAVGLLTLSSIALRASTQGQANHRPRRMPGWHCCWRSGICRNMPVRTSASPPPRTSPVRRMDCHSPQASQPRNDKSITATNPRAFRRPARHPLLDRRLRQSGHPRHDLLSNAQPDHRPLAGEWQRPPAFPPPIPPAAPASCLRCHLCRRPNGDVRDAAKAVVLVGKNSVGEAADSTRPLRRRSARRCPGQDKDPRQGGSAKPVGRFAWWVGDEGVKAKINRDQTFDDKANYAP